jgi:hypothetical protein
MMFSAEHPWRLETDELPRRGDTMATSVLKQLAEIDRLDFSILKERWRALFGTEPPGYNRVFLTKRLAHRIQEVAYGGLPQAARAQAARILEGKGCDDLGRPGRGQPATKTVETPVEGTVLLREWDGELHRVTVVAEGFEYRGRPYRSLSLIARTITGTNWSGPRFFGLKRGAGKKP